MHITAGPCLTWADGKAAVHENWVETSYVPITNGFNDLAYESVHPEPVTLPRRFPNVNRIRTLGALNPAPFNGFARGLGAAVNSGALSMDAAVNFLESVQNKLTGSWSDISKAISAQFRGGDISLNQVYGLASNGLTSLKPWNFALWGVIYQIRKGQYSMSEVLSLLINNVRGKQSPGRTGLLVRGIGISNGSPAVVIRRTPTSLDGSSSRLGMATSIGACCAAFALLALDMEAQRDPGVYCPEDWAKPVAFFEYMEKLGIPRNQLIESVQG
jgi:hypothetical protein